MKAPVIFLTADEVAARWRMSKRTLEGWRQRGLGPAFKKIGGKVVYPLRAVEEFEKADNKAAGRLEDVEPKESL